MRVAKLASETRHRDTFAALHRELVGDTPATGSSVDAEARAQATGKEQTLEMDDNDG